MCGICGYVTRDFEQIPDSEIITAMCSVLAHHGSYARGIYTDVGIGLGHQSLKGSAPVMGNQPVSDATGRYCLVFDGAVYNWRELRDELTASGFVFRTQSYAEVLLYGLIRHGLDFLCRVNGMFALALWDKAERTLTLVRDRFGGKPLYWLHTSSGNLIFASEATAIPASAQCPFEVERSALGLYLAFSYIPGEQSILRNVKRLLPGQWLRFTHGGSPVIRTWWNLADEWRLSMEKGKAVDGQWPEAFLTVLEDAVRLCLHSDVPLGAFLSGGIDSATIAALMKRQKGVVRTYTMAFRDKSYNEAKQARETALAIGADHFEGLADITSADCLLDIARRLDEPFADTSIIPTDALCRMARKHVAVALSGEGADELLAGYATLQADALYRYVRHMPGFLFRPLQRLINALPDNYGKVNTVFRLKQFASAYPRDPADAHASWRLLFDRENLGRLFPEESGLLSPFEPFRVAWNESEGLSEMDRMLFIDYKTWLADDILVKADRTCRGHGLEVRSPFLDHRLFDLCAGMPAHYKRTFRQGKVILRQAARSLLPAFVLTRPKTGFNAPVSNWIRNEWREVAEDFFSPASVTTGGLEPQTVAQLWREHVSGKRNHGFQLFALLVYLIWHKEHY